MNLTLSSRAPADVPDGFVDLLKAVDKDNPDKKDIRELRRWLEERPELALATTNLAEIAKNAIIETGPIQQKSVKMCVETGMAQQKNDLGYQDAPALEQLLIDNIVLCWLRLHVVEIEVSKNTQGSHTLSAGRYWDQRLSVAQMRYLRAIETLARVRKTNVAIQVNIAKQQINSLAMDALTTFKPQQQGR
ncbi:MAG: hypothetical protein HN929_13995 [Chloroflexi bacterium]|mgnify:FL=1|nr:hypothetical protein [Chloroflexota bacterium]